MTVESIEAAVARYAAVATMPDTTALEADLATVQRQLDTVNELQRRLPPHERRGRSTGVTSSPVLR